MTAQILQRVVVRASAYLAESGVKMNRSQSRRLLEMLDDALVATASEDEAGAIDEPNLLAWVMDRLPAYFPPETETIPAPVPPLLRGSIGYPCHD